MLDVESFTPAAFALLAAAVAFASAGAVGVVLGDPAVEVGGRAAAVAVGVGIAVYVLRRAEPG